MIDDDYGYSDDSMDYLDPSEMTPEQVEQMKNKQTDNFFTALGQQQAQAQQFVSHKAQQIAKGIKNTPKYKKMCDQYMVDPETVARKSIMDPQFRVDLEEVGTKGAMQKHFSGHKQKARVKKAKELGKGRVNLSDDKNFDAMIDALAGDILD